MKADHRAKGRTEEKLSGKEKENGEDNRKPTRADRAWKKPYSIVSASLSKKDSWSADCGKVQGRLALGLT